MPRNCNECEHCNNCNSYYGSAGCKHKDEIEAEGRKQEGSDPFNLPAMGKGSERAAQAAFLNKKDKYIYF